MTINMSSHLPTKTDSLPTPHSIINLTISTSESGKKKEEIAQSLKTSVPRDINTMLLSNLKKNMSMLLIVSAILMIVLTG